MSSSNRCLQSGRSFFSYQLLRVSTNDPYFMGLFLKGAPGLHAEQCLLTLHFMISLLTECLICGGCVFITVKRLDLFSVIVSCKPEFGIRVFFCSLSK